jgi:signal transduction histidine kinase
MHVKFRWLIFGLCLGTVVGIMAWGSRHLLRLEESRIQALRHERDQDQVRQALWRMESLASALLIRENARPAWHYQAFYTPEEAFTRNSTQVPVGQICLATPLFGTLPDLVQLHFQKAADGVVTSPQVPVGADAAIADQWYVSSPQSKSVLERMGQLKVLLSRYADLSQLSPVPTPAGMEMRKTDKEGVSVKGEEKAARELEQRANVVMQNKQLNRQSLANVYKPNARMKAAESPADSTLLEAPLSEPARPAVAKKPTEPLSPAPTLAGEMKAVWLDEELFLIRQAAHSKGAVIQGVWLDWRELEKRLLSVVQDVLPAARFQPVLTAQAWDDSDTLVTLPVRLIPGAMPLLAAAPASALRTPMLVAWASVALAALAIGYLLYRTLLLSERRGAFVSAVTHELRTPLTTFQMYSEMLAGEMVTEPAQRTHYLRTLCDESSRLMHLVENVLAYSRIEHGRTTARLETLGVEALVQRILPRLQQRAQAAQLEVNLQLQPAAAEALLRVDPLAVEQIFFNLTDNACKYAAPAAQKRVLEWSVRKEATAVIFLFRDYGPGLTVSARRQLFQPFAKSASEAAHSAPGVGLGLALCRRLARELHGSLTLVQLKESGTGFQLRLPCL